MREELVGKPFSMFDFTPVGACLAIGGVIFLAFGWRLLPGDRKGAVSMDEAFNLEGYTTEVTLPEGSPLAGKTVGEIEKLSEDEVEVLTILRSRDRVHEPPSNTKLRADHMLILMGQPDALKRLVDGAKLKLVRDENTGEIDAPDDDIGVMEAIVTAEFPLVDRSAMQYRLHDHHQVNLLAVSRSGRRIAHADRLDAPQGRRRHRAAGRSHHNAGGAWRTALPAAGRSANCSSAAAAAACCRWWCWRSR